MMSATLIYVFIISMTLLWKTGQCKFNVALSGQTATITSDGVSQEGKSIVLNKNDIILLKAVWEHDYALQASQFQFIKFQSAYVGYAVFVGGHFYEKNFRGAGGEEKNRKGFQAWLNGDITAGTYDNKGIADYIFSQRGHTEENVLSVTYIEKYGDNDVKNRLYKLHNDRKTFGPNSAVPPNPEDTTQKYLTAHPEVDGGMGKVPKACKQPTVPAAAQTEYSNMYRIALLDYYNGVEREKIRHHKTLRHLKTKKRQKLNRLNMITSV